MKKIEKIAKEAGLESVDLPYAEFGIPHELVRFAELIVQECCDYIDGVPSTGGGILIQSKQFIIINLKNHLLS